jgi:hypothetical protein
MHGRLKNGCSFFLAGKLACFGVFCFGTALIPVNTAAQNQLRCADHRISSDPPLLLIA